VSDEILLERIDKLELEKQQIKAQSNNRKWFIVFACALSIATVCTASFELWYGVVACGVLWIGSAVVYIKSLPPKSKPPLKPPARLLNEFFITHRGNWVTEWELRQRFNNGTSRLIQGFLDRPKAEKLLEDIIEKAQLYNVVTIPRKVKP